MKIRYDHAAEDVVTLSQLLHGLAEDMPQERAQRLKAQLITDIRAEPGGSPTTGSQLAAAPHSPRRRPFRLALSAGAAIAGLATAVTVLSVTGQQGSALPPASPGAIRLLAKVALAAERQPTPHVRDSQYTYMETTSASPFPFSQGTRVAAKLPRPISSFQPLRFSGTTQIWTPVADLCKTALERSVSQGVTFSNRFSEEGPGSTCPNAGSLNVASYRLLQSLPTDPHALLALIHRVERGHGPSPDQEAFVTIGDMLRNVVAPPDVTAALYRAAALIPGVTLVPDATDAIGRHGVAVAQTTGNSRDELIFSKTTLLLLGERVFWKNEPTSATAIVGHGFANRLGQIPPGSPGAAQPHK